MSLPIRQGRLFPKSPPPSKKFGKALATIKVCRPLVSIVVAENSQMSDIRFSSIGSIWPICSSVTYLVTRARLIGNAEKAPSLVSRFRSLIFKPIFTRGKKNEL